MSAATPGLVTLVGAGPGDPGLITRAGALALASAEVVVYDYLVHPRLLDLAPANALRIFAGKRKGRHAIPQEAINGLLVEHARAGRRVVRLKGGDPFVFGRGAEEAEHLQACGIPFRVIPGVTAAVGVTAYAGLPVTHRDASSAVALVTGHDDPAVPASRDRWADLARFPGTLVLYMASSRIEAIAAALIAAGKAPGTPAALVQWGTLPRQRTIVAPLADLPALVKDAELGPPALVVIGEVVARRPALSWYESLPLFGRRIVITRPRDEIERSAAALEALGAEVLAAPTVEILPVEDTRPLDDVLRRLNEFDWLVFTSSNGVRHVLDRLDVLGLDLRALGHLRLAAIGPTTADALKTARLRADVVPDEYSSEGLVNALAGRVAGTRVLLARADRGRALLREQLSRIADVVQVAVYRNIDAPDLPYEILERIESGTVDWITLTSSAITERLHALLPEESRARIGTAVRLASLSPVTSATVERLGWTISAEAATYTWDGLIAAILAAEASKSP